MARTIARIAIAAAAAFTALTLLWRLGLLDAFSFPPPPTDLRGWNAFSVYPWAELVLMLAMVAACVTAIILRVVGRRSAAARVISTTLIVAVLVGAVMVYLPLYGMTLRRTDRIRGSVEEPVLALRLIVSLFALTLAMNVLLVVAARARHTPDLTRRAVSALAVVTTAVYLHLFWVFVVFPLTIEWWPADWQRADLLRPVDLCRGATLWHLDAGGSQAAFPIGRIDDLWLNFADPRSGGRRERAISFDGTFYEGYFWMTLPETAQLRVRVDDPALVNCDGTWRREDVSPGTWHKVGVFPLR
ncbi:MAG: hypothetical protein AABO58_21875 [Acidobacteriota bacterium]